MLSQDLVSKIDTSIKYIQDIEPLALQYNDFGFYVSFSGGKDSQIIYELTKLAKVKFKGVFFPTSVDPPELLTFIKNFYPEIFWIKPELTMYQLILKKKFLPSRRIMYCCQVLKERALSDCVIMLGLRKEESFNRGKRKRLNLQCINRHDRFALSPILEWSENDVWFFIKDRNLPYCSLYDKGFKRVGCVGCPINLKSQRRELALYPNIRKMYYNAIKKLMEVGRYENFANPDEVLEWWTSGISQDSFFSQKQQLSSL
jgi:phosphoadenosine phosphosulfate reductase